MLDYKPLSSREHVDVIKERFLSYGVLERDMDFTWEELQQIK
jgi:hypothetical protein